MQNGKIIVGITQGDSNGIGYEVIIKALADPRILEQFTPVIYGSSKLFGFYRKTIPEVEQMDTNAISSAAEAHARRVNIVNCLPDSAYAEPGQATAESAGAAIKSLETAVRELRQGLIDVLVTGPINKKAMAGEGFGFPGHTEYIQNAFGAPDALMFMVSHRLRLAVVTGHIPLKDVAAQITEERILSKLRLINDSLKRDFVVDQPRIAVLSLNPHSGDGGLLGTEEQDIIILPRRLLRAEPLRGLRRHPGDVPRPGARAVQGPLLRGRRELHRRPAHRPHLARPRHRLRDGRPRPGRPALHARRHLHRHRHLAQPPRLGRAPGGQDARALPHPREPEREAADRLTAVCAAGPILKTGSKQGRSADSLHSVLIFGL